MLADNHIFRESSNMSDHVKHIQLQTYVHTSKRVRMGSAFF